MLPKGHTDILPHSPVGVNSSGGVKIGNPGWDPRRSLRQSPWGGARFPRMQKYRKVASRNIENSHPGLLQVSLEHTPSRLAPCAPSGRCCSRDHGAAEAVHAPVGGACEAVLVAYQHDESRVRHFGVVFVAPCPAAHMHSSSALRGDPRGELQLWWWLQQCFFRLLLSSSSGHIILCLSCLPHTPSAAASSFLSCVNGAGAVTPGLPQSSLASSQAIIERGGIPQTQRARVKKAHLEFAILARFSCPE